MNVKNGFSTLNRLLGKKNKGNNLSKSSTNLTLTTQNNDPNIALSSQLEQNRITPLPIATSNAPFEQTFRITVLLPRDQLYVARLGAKTKLEKLLELVCENKQLDPKKYEFRHPIDTSQVFSCELTIGAVGLSEIRLCHKSEGYDNFNADEFIKLRHTGRDSVSSSEFSSRNSKHTLKTASPYSSTNSLNSVDSAGMSINYRGPVLSLPPLPPLGNKTTTSSHNPPIAPARKKRVAPRPPSQNSIPEREIISSVNGFKDNSEEFKLPLPRKDFHVSTPNLAPNSELTVLRSTEFHQSNASIDCNGNTTSSINGNIKTNGHINFIGSESSEFKKPTPKLRPSSMHISGSGVSLNTTENAVIRPNFECTLDASIESVKMPEPVPRKRIITAKKKAPAPPPRSWHPPIASPRHTAISLEVDEKLIDDGTNKSPQENGGISKFNENKRKDSSKDIAKEITSTKDTENSTEKILEKKIETVNENSVFTKEITHASNSNDIPESQCPTSIESYTPYTQIIEDFPLKPTDIQSKESIECSSDDEEQLKVYNLKLGKTIVKPLVEPQKVKDLSTTSTSTPEINHVADSEGISDINSLSSTSHGWTYTIPAPPTFADSPILLVEDTDSMPDNCNNESTQKSVDTTINFDCSKTPDPPITPIIKQTPPVDFEIFNEVTSSITKVADKDEANENAITSDIEDGYHGNHNVVELESNRDSLDFKEREIKRIKEIRVDNNFEGLCEEFINDEYGRAKHSVSPTSLESVDSNKTDVITELNTVITENKMETLIKKPEANDEIQSSKPCALTNFKIQTYNKVAGPVKTLNEDSSSPIIKENKSSSQNEEDNHEKLYKKRLSLTLNSSTAYQILNKTTRPNVTRSDSFHFTRYPNNNILDVDDNSLLTSRSSSYISLLNAQKLNNDKIKLNENLTNATRRKSSSELSIGESPSLQSLIVMKSILNSRKNSFSNDLSSENNSKNINGCVDYNENKNINIPNITIENNNRKNDENDDCDSSKENSPKNKLLSQEITSVERSAKNNDEPEKKWKYQGPPSINLSTWSERPKIQVSIKDDCDYKFGGGSSVFNTPIRTLPLDRGNRNSFTGPTSIGNVTAAATTISLSNPILSEKTINARPKVPFVRSVEYKKTTSTLQTTASDEPLPKSSTTYSRPLSAGNTMTLGRMPKINRTLSFVPTVKGFRNVENTDSIQKSTLTQNEVTNNYNDGGDMYIVKSIKVQANGFEKNNSNIERHILTLSTQNNVQICKSLNNTSNIKPYLDDKPPEKPKPENIPLFAQVTLRKTGLKERILSSQLEETEPTKPVPLQRIEKSNCAKLELQLTTTKSTDVSKQPQPHHVAPPPPPPPVVLSVVTKSAAGIKPIEDPRDQLLNAIRSFNKDSLKHS